MWVGRNKKYSYISLLIIIWFQNNGLRQQCSYATPGSDHQNPEFTKTHDPTPEFDLNYSMKAGSQNMSEGMKCTNVHTVMRTTLASDLVQQVWTKSQSPMLCLKWKREIRQRWQHFPTCKSQKRWVAKTSCHGFNVCAIQLCKMDGSRCLGTSLRKCPWWSSVLVNACFLLSPPRCSHQACLAGRHVVSVVLLVWVEN